MARAEVSLTGAPRTALAVLMALATCPPLAATLGAQARPAAAAASPVDDVLDRITGDINDLNYADALRRGRAFQGTEEALSLAQRVRWRLLMAAAFFPDDEARHQQGDSALRHLRALVRIAPDARFAPEMNWRGLDSLLILARERTFAAVVHGPASQRLAGGAAGRVEVVTSREARLTLSVVDRASGRVLQRDTAIGKGAQLHLRAHDDRHLLLPAGEYDLVLGARDVRGDDTLTTRYALVVEGEVPLLEPEPPLPASALRPERIAPPRVPSMVRGLVFAGATVGLASLARGDEALKARFGTDGRAYAVGGAMLIGVGAVVWRQRERTLPENIAANALARAEHDRAIARIIDANRTKLATYAATVRIAPEPR